MSLHRINRAAEVLPVALLRQIVRYDPEKGTFVWLLRPADHFPGGARSPQGRALLWNAKYAGKPAFTSADPRGYFRGEVAGVMIYAHRAAIALMNGEWPAGEVDHINRSKSDNRISNLRVVTHSENRRNTRDFEAAEAKRREAA